MIRQISSGNSTTIPLTAGTSFTGVWEDVSAFEQVLIRILSDQSASGFQQGLTLQFSSDGENIEHSETQFYQEAGTFLVVRTPTDLGQFCRVLFTNGANDQASFSLQTVYQTPGVSISNQVPLGPSTLISGSWHTKVYDHRVKSQLNDISNLLHEILDELRRTYR